MSIIYSCYMLVLLLTGLIWEIALSVYWYFPVNATG